MGVRGVGRWGDGETGNSLFTIHHPPFTIHYSFKLLTSRRIWSNMVQRFSKAILCDRCCAILITVNYVVHGVLGELCEFRLIIIRF